MKKLTKKRVTRKKNLSAKPLLQYVKNTSGERFSLGNGKLFQSFRSVKLSGLRNAVPDGTVVVTTKYKGDREKFTDEYGVNVVTNQNYPSVQIGCQIFEGQNAVKILKRARIAVA